MRNRRRGGVAWAAPLIMAGIELSGCGAGDAGPGAGVERRDSAGIEIIVVSTPREDFGPVGTVDTVPDLEIGALEGDPALTFGSVAGVRQMQDGSVIVADGQAREVRVFDPGGRHRATAGRRGEGPGEFRSLSSVPRAAGDTVWAWDGRNRRLWLFSTDGGLLGEAPLIPAGVPLPSRVAVLPDGSILAQSLWRHPSRRGSPPEAGRGMVLNRDTLVLSRYTAAGALADTVARIAELEMLSETTSQSEGMFAVSMRPPAFARSADWAALPDGVVGGSNDRFELRWWGLDGTLRRVTRARSLDRHLTPADVEALRDRLAEGADGSRLRGIETLFEASPTPEWRPAFQAILADPEGRVWVREDERWERGRPTWWLFDAAGGHPLGYVDFPAGLEVMEIGPDYVLGVYRDELDVPWVRRHPLRLSASR